MKFSCKQLCYCNFSILYTYIIDTVSYIRTVSHDNIVSYNSLSMD